MQGNGILDDYRKTLPNGEALYERVKINLIRKKFLLFIIMQKSGFVCILKIQAMKKIQKRNWKVSMKDVVIRGQHFVRRR